MLWKASNLLQRLHADVLKDFKITPTQFSLMTCLVYLSAESPVTATSIIQFTGMDKMMVSDLLKTLEGKKLLFKRPNPADGRSSLVEPSAKGRALTNAAVGKVEALDAEFFESVSDLPSFHRNLIRLVAAKRV